MHFACQQTSSSVLKMLFTYKTDLLKHIKREKGINASEQKWTSVIEEDILLCILSLFIYDGYKICNYKNAQVNVKIKD